MAWPGPSTSLSFGFLPVRSGRGSSSLCPFGKMDGRLCNVQESARTWNALPSHFAGGETEPQNGEATVQDSAAP